MASNLATATIEILDGQCTCLDGVTVTGVVGDSCGNENLPPRGVIEAYIPCRGIRIYNSDCETRDGPTHRWLVFQMHITPTVPGVANADISCDWEGGSSALCQETLIMAASVSPVFQSDEPLLLVYEFSYDLSQSGTTDCRRDQVVSFRVTVTRGSAPFFELQNLPVEYEVEMSGWIEGGVSCDYQNWLCNTDHSTPAPKRYSGAETLNSTFPLKMPLIGPESICLSPFRLPCGSYQSLQTDPGTGQGCPGDVTLSAAVTCFPSCPNGGPGGNIQFENFARITLGWRHQLTVQINNPATPNSLATYDPPADWDDWKDDGSDMTFTLASFTQSTDSNVTPPSTITVRRVA